MLLRLTKAPNIYLWLDLRKKKKKKNRFFEHTCALVSGGSLAGKSLELALVLGFQSLDSGPSTVWVGGVFILIGCIWLINQEL